MRDTYKAVLVMFFVPILLTLGLSQTCANEIVVVASTALTGLTVGLWKYAKK